MSQHSLSTTSDSGARHGKRELRHLDQNLRTGEVDPERPVLVWDSAIEDFRLSYEHPRDDDFENGHLWLRHFETRAGKFRWKAINTPRTRRMMREHLCMVCSSSCVREDGRIWWLFHQDPETLPDGTPVTNLLPTCPGCVPEARETCPHLIAHARLVTVASTRPFAVTADLYGPGEGFPAPAVKVAHEVVIPYEPDAEYWLRFALGKQPWVALLNMRDEVLI